MSASGHRLTQQLLAAQASTTEASDASPMPPHGGGGGGGPGNNASRPKRTLIESACSACRRRKSRCDGVRPACSRCQALRTDCMYEAEEGESRWSALRRRNQILETERAELRELIAFIQTLPEDNAQDLFQRLRAGSHDDGLRLLREMRDGVSPTPTSSGPSPGAHSLPIHSSGQGEPRHRLPPISAMLDLSSASPSESGIPPPPPAYYLKNELSHGSTSSGASLPPDPPVSHP